MHIAIEGMDGVGKTTVAKILAQKLNWTFVEKPFHFISDSDDSFTKYLELTQRINNILNSDIRALFYGIGNIYASKIIGETNIVTDRHLVSNFIWNGSTSNLEFFDCLLNLCGKPTFTIILYADDKTRKERILHRGGNTTDLQFIDCIPDAYNRMEWFLKHYNMRYAFVDSTNMNIFDTTSAIYDIISTHIY